MRDAREIHFDNNIPPAKGRRRPEAVANSDMDV
jgi:hypothetical protein